MTLPQDERLEDTPMAPVQCANCAARVLARKSSWQQTSIQWDAPARATCAEQPSRPGNDHNSQPLSDTCNALRESIRAAAVTGALRVTEDDY